MILTPAKPMSEASLFPTSSLLTIEVEMRHSEFVAGIRHETTWGVRQSRDSKLSIRPLTPTLGAEIGALTAPLDDASWRISERPCSTTCSLLPRPGTPQQQLRLRAGHDP